MIEVFLLSEVEKEALWLSFKVSGTAVVAGFPLALGVAWIAGRAGLVGRFILDSVIHLPLVLPPVVVGYILLVFFGSQGLIGSVLDEWFGIRLVFSWQGAVVSTMVVGFPFMVRSIRLGLEGIDPELSRVARTLGASRWDAFLTVALPLMTPAILGGILTAFAVGLGAFGAVITFVSNIPGETRTLPLAIYTAIQTPGADVVAARLAALSILLSMGVLLLNECLGLLIRRWSRC